MASALNFLSLSTGASSTSNNNVTSAPQLSAGLKLRGFSSRALFVKYGGRTTSVIRAAAEVGEEVAAETVETVLAAEASEDTPKPKAPRNLRKITLDPKDIVIGSQYTGKVRSIVPYGAFVDIGTFTDGLVHISELSDGFVKNVEDVVKKGDELSVYVKAVDLSSKRISLSLFDPAVGKPEKKRENTDNEAGPRPRAGDRKVAGRGNKDKKSDRKETEKVDHGLKQGQLVEGVVKDFAPFGAFIELQPGVTGLLRSSASLGANLGSILKVGQTVDVTIASIRGGKISLTMKSDYDIAALNTGVQIIASNPFQVAFRTANLVTDEDILALQKSSSDDEDVKIILNAEKSTEEPAEEPESVKAEAVVEAEEELEEVEIVEEPVVENSLPVEGTPVAEEAPKVESSVSEAVEEPVVEASASAEEVPVVEETVPVEVVVEAAAPVEEAPVAETVTPEAVVPEAEEIAPEAPVEEVKEVVEVAAEVVETPVPEPAVVESSVQEAVEAEKPAEVTPVVPEPVAEVKPASSISPAVVKALRDETGAGMMACKAALKDADGDIEKAREILRKKGLASAEKKASRVATEGLIHSYIHDGRIGVLVEVNCETDFVSRGADFRTLVQDIGLQIAASPDVTVVSVDEIPAEVVAKEREIELQREDLLNKPEAIRAKIVDGRIGKVLNKFALLEQPFIKDDKVLIKDVVKQAVAKLGENIQIRRFRRFNLGEGLEKKSSDFAAEVAAAAAVVAPPPPKEEKKEEAPKEEVPKVAVSAALVKELRESTGAGMMDCKKALAASNNDLEKATEFLRKKGLASADKKSGRNASEGLIGTYIHDGRIGVLVEVNCETDFVARGEKFRELVKDLGMQIVACPQVSAVSVEEIDPALAAKEREIALGQEDLQSKPEAIREKIVEGRMAKRLGELALLEQPYIKDDKKLIKELIKETVAALGENIKVRRFERFNLGEGLEKKTSDFGAEVAAAAAGN